MDPRKIEIVTKWHRPLGIGQLQSSLRIAITLQIHPWISHFGGTFDIFDTKQKLSSVGQRIVKVPLKMLNSS